MYCPECGSEYREGFVQCGDCEIPLVDNPPLEPEHPDIRFVTVLEAGDPGEIALAESILMEAQIPYFKKGDQIQDLFALGRVPFGFNPITGPVEIQVAEENVTAAHEALEELKSVDPSEQELFAED